MDADFKSSTHTKWWLWPIIAILAVVLVGGLSGCGSPDSSSSDGETVAIEDSEKLTDLAVGDSATVNKVTVTVNSITGGEPTAAGTATLAVNVTYIIKNPPLRVS